jgi:hypothetical protein
VAVCIQAYGERIAIGMGWSRSNIDHGCEPVEEQGAFGRVFVFRELPPKWQYSLYRYRLFDCDDVSAWGGTGLTWPSVPFEAVYVTASTFPNAESAMHILKAVDAPKTRGANFREAAKSEFGPVSSSKGRTRYCITH